GAPLAYRLRGLKRVLGSPGHMASVLDVRQPPASRGHACLGSPRNRLVHDLLGPDTPRPVHPLDRFARLEVLVRLEEVLDLQPDVSLPSALKEPAPVAGSSCVPALPSSSQLSDSSPAMSPWMATTSCRASSPSLLSPTRPQPVPPRPPRPRPRLPSRGTRTPVCHL